jgi:hypothetical protein
MQLEVFGGLARSDAFGAAVGVEVDVSACRITEGGADGGDGAREIGTRRCWG